MDPAKFLSLSTFTLVISTFLYILQVEIDHLCMILHVIKLVHLYRSRRHRCQLWNALGNNLPSPDKVISLYKSRNITSLRLFNPNSTMLSALQNSNIDIILGTYNEDLQNLANNKSFVTEWVATNVLPYSNSVNFRYICVGNEVIPGDLASFVLPAMKNLDAAMKDANVKGSVSTAVSSQVLGVSYPPSNGTFADDAEPTMTPIIQFLEEISSPLLFLTENCIIGFQTQ